MGDSFKVYLAVTVTIFLAWQPVIEASPILDGSTKLCSFELLSTEDALIYLENRFNASLEIERILAEQRLAQNRLNSISDLQKAILSPRHVEFTRKRSLLDEDERIKHDGKIVVVFKTLEQGLKELHESMRTSDRETGWFFLPEVGIWISAIEFTAQNNSVSTPAYLLPNLLHTFSELIDIHTHPRKIVQSFFTATPTDDSLSTVSALPSGGDLLSMILTQHSLVESTAEARIRNMIVSEFGVTEYFLNPQIDQSRRVSIGALLDFRYFHELLEKSRAISGSRQEQIEQHFGHYRQLLQTKDAVTSMYVPTFNLVFTPF